MLLHQVLGVDLLLLENVTISKSYSAIAIKRFWVTDYWEQLVQNEETIKSGIGFEERERQNWCHMEHKQIYLSFHQNGNGTVKPQNMVWWAGLYGFYSLLSLVIKIAKRKISSKLIKPWIAQKNKNEKHWIKVTASRNKLKSPRHKLLILRILHLNSENSI